MLPGDVGDDRTRGFECIRLLCKLVKHCILYQFIVNFFEGGCLP